jgi:hypothetical protein
VKRFALCFAAALIVMVVLPAFRPYPRGGGSDAFFAMAGQVVAVLLASLALYAAVLFVEYVWTRRRSADRK